MMMIGITLSLGAVLVVWAGTSYGAFSGGSQLFYQQRQQALQENFVIEEVFFEKNSTAGQIFIFVRNVGLININVVAIYVNGVSVASTLTTATTCPFSGTPSSANIPVGTPCEFTWPQTVWTSGTPFYIVVASARGNQVATTMRGP
jgi:hypothetical protein